MKNYRKCAKNPNNRRRWETYINNKIDVQNSNTQGHVIINVSNNQKETENIKQTTTNGNIDKQDESINIQTHYGRLSRKPYRLTHH